MQRFAREPESAVGANRRSHSEALAVGLDAALDVAEIVFEGGDSDRDLVAEIVK